MIFSIKSEYMLYSEFLNDISGEIEKSGSSSVYLHVMANGNGARESKHIIIKCKFCTF
jgi:hypothetical protein